MRRVILIFLFGFYSVAARADHITGGEMYYTYLGSANGMFNYDVTLKLFMRCNSGRQFPNPAIISIFDRSSFQHVQADISAFISSQQVLQMVQFDPCISNPPDVCYEVAYYHFQVSLPSSTAGYILSSQVNFRIRGISNLGGGQVGATYTCEIPGNADQSNNSAFFTGSDLVVVCAGNYFSYSFGAKDNDAATTIRYSFCAAYISINGGSNGTPPGTPPYPSVPYTGGYSESIPLGSRVSINPNTGLITGVAPPQGIYVVTVCADEIRNGNVIATQRKDLQINVADCSIASAVLEEDYMLCGSTRSISISNNSNSPLITSYDWEVYDPSGTAIFNSISKDLNYTFGQNGKYSVRLIVNKGQPCSDTTFAPVYVFPGLAPDFDAAGICITKPSRFTDKTTLLSGSINSWSWDFGENYTTLDVSTNQNAAYTFPSQGRKNVQLIVTTTDGCRDTVIKVMDIVDKPPIHLAFRDTLICVNDIVQLQASGTGNFNWTPSATMVNATSPNPTVSPVTTTKYYVELETEGCRNSDSMQVRVVDHVNLQVMNNTTICKGDTIRLSITSDGLRYEWTPAVQVMDPFAKNPLAITTNSTDYRVRATIGGCSANGLIRVNTVPYPLADAGADTIICYNTAAQLHGITDGSSWEWTPTANFSNTSALDQVVRPPQGFNSYILLAYDNRGCSKPGRDTVVVHVLPRIQASAGRDTVVIINQPLQLNASGGNKYLWSPPISLSATNIPNPVALYSEPSNGLLYKVKVYNIAGCVDSAYLSVKVFATLPTVFVPNAFTPNNDGKNDILRATVVGMKSFEYFMVYNRWGQLVFTTPVAANGWDGRVAGQMQGSNTYVWMVKATDYLGRPYFRKGTVVLIR